jgi:hypothetical protein
MKHKPVSIDNPVRLEAAKELILKHRAKAGAKASYELYGILFNGRTSIDRIDHAPTSADFSTMIRKKRIASLFTAYDMVVEFRGAWKSETEGKVVAWEAADVHA